VRIDLTGEDLKQMGIPTGPRYKRILASLMDAKLDGQVRTRDDEVAFVAKLLP
jgi:tRNA nucleotidyltransferase (CCA-adding enzyme)